MSELKFHKQVGFEEGALREIQSILDGIKEVGYTNHAKQKVVEIAQSYYYGNTIITPLKKNLLKLDDIFEYTRENGQIKKFAVQINNLSDRFNFAYSVSREGSVITCWVNAKADSHATLNRRNYQKV